jgi:hypothetical protein
MKIYLDDMREPNMSAHELLYAEDDHIYFKKDWIIVRNVDAFRSLIDNTDQAILEDGHIEAVSFDHDLGTKETGYDAMVILEEMAHGGYFKCNNIMVHTANPSVKKKMYDCANKIMEFSRE